MIIGKVAELKQQIKELESKIASIQKECSHPKEALDEKSGSDSGNYDPSADISWVKYHCHLCDKKWTDYFDNQGNPLA
jgi:hypothetical protein